MRQKLLATAWARETSSGLDLSAPYDHGVFHEMRRDNGLNVVYPDPALP